MSYAIIDFKNSRWTFGLGSQSTLGETNLFIPHAKNGFLKIYANMINRILDRKKIGMVVLNEELMQNNNFCERLLSNKKYIITGKRLYKVILERALKDIAHQMNLDLKNLRVALLIKEYAWDNLDLIKNIAKEVKSLTVITNDKKEFESLANELYKAKGIVLKVLDNTKTNLKYVNIVANVDFTVEELEKVNISSNAIVISGFAKDYRIKRKFNGIIIKKIDIISGLADRRGLDNLALCEAKIYNCLRKLKENDRVFTREGYMINGFIGVNGKITKHEFERIGKILLDKN